MGSAVVPIARNTFREAVRQPVFWILIFMSLLLLWVTSNLPLWTITGRQDDEKLAKDIGLATVTMCALMVALFACSSVISEELDKKTAMTVLSKPVTRGPFGVGKELGMARKGACGEDDGPGRGVVVLAGDAAGFRGGCDLDAGGDGHQRDCVHLPFRDRAHG